MKWGSLNCASAAQPDCERSKNKRGKSDLLELDKGIEAPAQAEDLTTLEKLSCQSH